MNAIAVSPRANKSAAIATAALAAFTAIEVPKEAASAFINSA
jgi:hypothetical protein